MMQSLPKACSCQVCLHNEVCGRPTPLGKVKAVKMPPFLASAFVSKSSSTLNEESVDVFGLRLRGPSVAGSLPQREA